MSQSDETETQQSAWYCRTVFFVENVDTSVEYYRNRLGFTEMWRHEEAAAQVEREGLEIILNKEVERTGKGRVFISLDPGNVSRLENELKTSGVEVSHQTWGMNVMVIEDLDGNELYFTDD